MFDNVYNEYNKLKTKEETKYIFSMDGINLIQCNFCSLYWDIEPNEEILNCSSCSKSTCLKCKELEHKRTLLWFW